MTRSTLFRSLPTIESCATGKLGLGEPVDDRLRLGIGVVRPEDVALRHAQKVGLAAERAAIRSGVAHPVIFPRASKVLHVSATRVFVARLAGCSVFDPDGDKVGKVRDVLVVYRSEESPTRGRTGRRDHRQAPRVPVDRARDEHRLRAGHHDRADQPAPLRAARRRGARDLRAARPQGRAARRIRRGRHRGRRDRRGRHPANGRSATCSCAARAPEPRPFGKGATVFADWNGDPREDRQGRGPVRRAAHRHLLRPAARRPREHPARPPGGAPQRGRRGAARRAPRRRARGDARGRPGRPDRPARRRPRRRRARPDAARRRGRPDRAAPRGARRGAARAHGARRGGRRPHAARPTPPTPPAA